MSGRLITVPSLKRKPHKPQTPTHQHAPAPLATHDDCEFSDVSDVENNSDTEDIDHSVLKRKLVYSVPGVVSATMEQDTVSGAAGDVTPVNENSPTEEVDIAAEFSAAAEDNYDAVVDQEVAEDNIECDTADYITESCAPAVRLGVVSPVDILITEPAGEESYYEGEDLAIQEEEEQYTPQPSDQEPTYPTEETYSQDQGTTDDTVPSEPATDVNPIDLDARGIPFDPNTFYDDNGYPYLDGNGDPYDPNLYYLDESGCKQPYYDENGVPYYDENGQPYQARVSETTTNVQEEVATPEPSIYYQKEEDTPPPRPPAVYRESINKAPSRPPPPDKSPTSASAPSRPSAPPGKGSAKPAKPPPPSTAAIKKAIVEPAVPPPLAPPPEYSKRRTVEKNYPGAKQEFIDSRFPFKSHFEKKPLVGNAKKGILNVFKSDKKKKSRHREKEEEQIERIINTVDSDEEPINESSDEWKKFQEIQNRITSSLQSSQTRIKNLNSKEVDSLISSKPVAGGEKDSNWATFCFEEDVEMTSTTEQPVEDLLGIGSGGGGDAADAFNDTLNGGEIGDSGEIGGFDDSNSTGGFGLTDDLDSFLGGGSAIEDSHQVTTIEAIKTTTTDQPETVTSIAEADDFDFEELDMNRSASKGEIAALAAAPTKITECEAEFETDFGFATPTPEGNKSDTGGELKATTKEVVQETFNLDDDFGFDSKRDNASMNDNNPTNFDMTFGFSNESNQTTSKTTKTSGKENSSAYKKFEFGFDEGESLFTEGDSFLNQQKTVKATELSEAAFGGDNETINDAFDDMAPSTTSNPFGADNFTASKANTAFIMETKKNVSVGIAINPRPRPKPQRQETLSGNNPFRRPSQCGEDIENDINDMPTEQNKKVEPVVPVVSSKPKSFDPYKTIYPDSDKDSSDDDEIDFKIKIKSKTSILDKPTESGPVPLIPAPPVNDTQRSNPFVQYITEPTFSNQEIDDILPMFQDEPEEWGEQPKAVNVDSAFAVDWSEKPADMIRQRSPSPEPEKFETFGPTQDKLEWKLMMRGPEKKKTKVSQMSKYTSNRWWKEVTVRLETEKEHPVIKVFETPESTEAIRVVRLEPVMQLSRDKLQYYDKYGKLHIVKVNHIVYKEMVGMRTEKFSLKNLTHLVSHKPKQNVALDHLPIRTEVLKFGSFDQKSLRSLMFAIEDAMMMIKSYRDTSLQYTKEEVCCFVQDEYEAILDKTCIIEHHIGRTRIFFNAFVTGKTYCVLGINDKWRFGNEVVRRSDIIPIMHDNWITIYEPEFHSSINMEEYAKDHMIKFHPLDGCRFELMRFRTRLRDNRELPLTVNFKTRIDGARVLMRCDLMIPGFFSSSKTHGSVYCDDIEIRLPIPEEWIYHFRVEKHMKYGSVHSALRKPGKIKGLERITQMAQSFLPPSMLEVDVGLAKYEHLYKAIVWRIPRLPEKHEGAYKPHLLTCKLQLGPHDPMPAQDNLEKRFYVEYKMPGSTVSGATVRSISVEHDTSEPERFVKYCAKHVYSVEIDYEFGRKKEPALKSILDDPPEGGIVEKDSSSSEESSDEDEDDAHGTEAVKDPEAVAAGAAAAAAVGMATTGNLIDTDDLLGLGGDFGGFSSSVPSSATPQKPMSSADLLMQQLGSFGGGTSGDILMADD